MEDVTSLGWVRVLTYLAGFAIGVLAVVLGFVDNFNVDKITLGLMLMGVAGVAVPNVPGVMGGRGKHGA